ncbi:MAG: aspartyl/asparaginyl beta-hydroxylase domain-containing protein [Rudaea sp.]
MNDNSVARLANAAGAAATAGRWQEAERLWSQVRDLEPENSAALFSLGVHAFQRGDLVAACELLEKARIVAPRDPMIMLALGRVHREAGRTDLEWDTIISALDINPYFLPGLLARGEFLERGKQSKAAAAVFRNVLKVAGDDAAQWPQALRKRLEHASTAVARDGEELTAFLKHRVNAQREAVDAAVGSRWDEAVSILAGKSKPYASECNQLHVPRLPAITFYDDGLFPWMHEVEALTSAIKTELQEMLERRQDEFVPYIQYAPGAPVNQWDKLNHSRDWSGFHLYQHGAPVREHLDQCPKTAEALALVDAVKIAGLCPNAMFSALAPHVHIPPHTGETNARLVAHLPLVVPENCHYRVGYYWKQWREGKCWVFDDCIEHEARNDSDQVRAILMFDVWNPYLSLAERELTSALAEALNDYRSQTDGT